MLITDTSGTPSSKRKPIKCDHAGAIPRERHWAILETGSGIEKGYDRGDHSHRGIGNSSPTKGFAERILW